MYFGRFEILTANIVLAIVLVTSFFIERPWCRYACPLGAFNSLVDGLSVVKIQRNAELCKNCSVCTKACPVGVAVESERVISHHQCMSCLSCVEACKVRGALSVKSVFSLPGLEPLLPRLGTLGKGYVAVAAALLAFFLVIGGAMAMGLWTTQTALDPSGKPLALAEAKAEEVKGWMKVGDVAESFGVSLEELYAEFGIPDTTPPETPLKDLEKVAPYFSVEELRAWLQERAEVSPSETAGGP